AAGHRRPCRLLRPPRHPPGRRPHRRRQGGAGGPDGRDAGEGLLMDDTAFVSPDSDLAGLARRIFDDLGRDGHDGVGISRETYGPGESRALDYLQRLAGELDLETGRDAMGSLVVSLPGTAPDLPAVVSGSHLDSVPQGG